MALSITPALLHPKRFLNHKGKFLPNNKGHGGPRTSATKRGETQKRGCLCGFLVKRLYMFPDVAQLSFSKENHVNKDGWIVHGSAVNGDKGRFVSHLSQDMVDFVQKQLRLGLSVSQIMMKHKRYVKDIMDTTGELSRDIFILEDDVRNMAGKLALESYKRHVNDAKSVRMWVAENHDSVFFIQDENNTVTGGLTGTNMPFTLGIQTKWQRQMMSKHGHMKGVAIDATFGTNENKV